MPNDLNNVDMETSEDEEEDCDETFEVVDSDYEMSMTTATVTTTDTATTTSSHAPFQEVKLISAMRILTQLKEPRNCWFNILYEQPEMMVDLIDIAIKDLQAFSAHPDLPYVLITLNNVKKIKDPLMIQFNLIYLYIIPSMRELFRPRCSEVVWVLAKPHLLYQIKTAMLKFSLLHTPREEIENWVELCLQPLALGHISLLVQRWDPGYMSHAFREECGQVGVDDTLFDGGKIREPLMVNFATFRQRDLSEGISLKLCLEVGRESWQMKAEEINLLGATSSIEESKKMALDYLLDITSGSESSKLLQTSSIPELIAAEMSLSRPDRSGVHEFQDPTPPWIPGDPLISVIKNYEDYVERMASLERYRVPPT